MYMYIHIESVSREGREQSCERIAMKETNVIENQLNAIEKNRHN